ncbi:ABC transporter ATP-binding protein [Ornithinibacillus halophilus]|uniref:ABC-2 type transport system ATP-binding protein n=1 Tax=Ornithinibacillus halophilus TaxID=930117 RepID=A0A1M5E0P6_9BACI|nr:ABC transporter ATP-binding protein [Ornithinibacillus halophilus]SHF72838.1 ABC-2 type transport system ATP-binding protein [Ornithinibacillus halophilus]
MEEPILTLENVNKKIGKHHIIKDLSFDVYPGEVFGFLGPNGAGKTTTIRMIVGLTNVTSGEIKINGSSISKDYKKAIENVGAIVENPELYPYLSARKNLIHFGRMSKNVTEEDIQQRLELVGLDHVKDKKVKRFSLGMKQRLGIAQAMIHNPKILILDEPTNGLDPAGIRQMRDYLRGVAKKENIAILVSSHVLSEMELMCDRFAIIKEGKLVQVEDVSNESNEEVVSSYRMEVNEVEKAKVFIEEQLDTTVEIQDGMLKVQVSKEGIGKMVSSLTRNDIIIYQVIREKQTLEDRFLQATSQEVS